MEEFKPPKEVQRLLQGCLDKLPPKQSNSRTISLFLSSTFTDYAHERNLLTTQIFPWLKTYCKNRGLEFRSVDMRWGVRDEAQNDHKTTEIVLHQIDASENISQGPFFVCFVGDRYGYRPYPNVIAADEFEILVSAAKAASKDVNLLHTWFKKDTNAVPAVYILQSITSQLKFYEDDTEENAEKQKQDEKEWAAVDELLTITLRAAASLAYKHKHISEETKHKYFRSVTENEIDEGILKRHDADRRTLCFMREFTSPEVDRTDQKAGRFMDLDGGFQDTEASELLQKLKTKTLPSKLSQRNIFHYSVPWQPEGIDPDHPDHALYLCDFEKTFLLEIERLIEEFQEHNIHCTIDHAVYEEIYSHAELTLKKAHNFCGREDVLALVKKRLVAWYKSKEVDPYKVGMALDKNVSSSGEASIENDEKEPEEEETVSSCKQLHKQIMNVKPPKEGYHKPVVVFGPSGSGKSSLSAKVHQVSSEWFRNGVRIMRFLGTTQLTSSLRLAIISTCQQIWLNYDVHHPSMDDLSKDLMFLIVYFKTLLMTLDTCGKPLLILWDAVDQLSQVDYAHSMQWLPTSLNSGVHMLVTVNEDSSNDCLVNMHLLIGEETCFINLPPMTSDTACKAINLRLKDCQRTLMKDQFDYMVAAFKRCPQLLFLSVSVEQAKTWKSYTPIDQCAVGITTRAAIEQMFSKLETDHGQILVSKVLGLITISTRGLSDSEIEDLCSLDDEVLQDSYLYHLPPSETLIRIPQLLCPRLIADLTEYLSLGVSGNIKVQSWSHRQFEETAWNRYCQEEVRPELHRSLVEYFTGEWSNQVKPLVLYKKKKGNYPNSLRGVPSQPINFSDNSINKRKLIELPHHMILLGRYEQFVLTTCCDIEWIYNKIKAFSMNGLLQDLAFACQHLHHEIEDMSKAASTTKVENPNENDSSLENDLSSLRKWLSEITAIKDTLVLSTDAVSKDVDNISVQILGQLATEDESLAESLKLLRQSALQWMETCSTPLLVPRSTCLPRPDSFLRTYFDFTMALPGDNTEGEKKIHVLYKSSQLVCVERQIDGDLIKFQDIKNNFQTRKMRVLPHSATIRRVDFLGDERYMYLEVYSQHNGGEIRKVLLDTVLDKPVVIPKGCRVICFSPSARFCFFTREAMPTSQAASDGEKPSLGHVMGYIYEFSSKQMKPVHVKDVSFGVMQAMFCANDSLVLLAGDNGKYYGFNVESGRLKCSFGNVHNAQIPPVEKKLAIPMHFLPENRLLVTGLGHDCQNILYLYDLQSGETMSEFKGHDSSIVLVAVNSTGTIAASASNSIRIWDLKSYQQKSIISKQGQWNAVAFAGGEYDLLLTTCAAEPGIDVWYVGTETEPVYPAVPLLQLTGHSQDVMYLEVASNLDYVITGALDNTVRAWSLSGIHHRAGDIIQKHRGGLRDFVEEKKVQLKSRPNKMNEGSINTTCTAVSKDGSVILVGTAAGWLILYELRTMKQVGFVPENGPISSVLSTKSGTYFVSCSTSVKVWSSTEMKLVHELRRPENDGEVGGKTSSCIAEGNDVVIVGYGGTGRGMVWNLNTGQLLAEFSCAQAFSSVAITSDAQFVVSCCYDYPVVYGVDSGELLTNGVPDTSTDRCTCLIISPNDKWIASGSTDGSVKVMQLINNKCVFTMHHKSSVNEAVFSPDSTQLLTAGFKHILIWSMSNGNLMHTLSRHSNNINKLCLINSYLVSAGEDKQIIVWDLKELHSVASFKAHCPLGQDVSVAEDLSSIMFAPAGVSYLGILQPNPALHQLLQGQNALEVSKSVQKAQAVALTFSSQKVAQKTSSACHIL